MSAARVRRMRSRDRAEALAVRLLGEAPPELAHGLRELLRVAGERAAERAVHVVVGDARGDGLHEPARDRLVAAQQVVGLEPGGVERDVGS